MNESVAEPLLYYQHNVEGTINLATVMKKHGCKNVRALGMCRVATVG